MSLLLITAIVQPARLEAVTEALAALGVPGVTVTRLLGHSLDELAVEVYRGQQVTSSLLPRVKLDLVVPAEDAADLIHAIRRAAGPDPGDGRVWTAPVEGLVRVRTGERGIDAL